MSGVVHSTVLHIWILCTLSIGSASTTTQRIWFPDEIISQVPFTETFTEGSPCTADKVTGEWGSCAIFAACPNLIVSDEPIEYCSSSEASALVCCPSRHLVKNVGEVSAPFLYYYPLRIICGTTYEISEYSGVIGHWVWPIYHLNEVADELRAEGIPITVIAMFGDAIWNMSYPTGTTTKIVAYDRFAITGGVVGGQAATREMSYFMALIGERKEDKTQWLCDGVLINVNWIISAAHCFITSVTPNVVRLGDYNWETADEFGGLHPPHDSSIAQVVYHPQFEPSHRYHDVVLIRIDKPYPLFSRNILPICLPWDDHTGRNLVGQSVTLTGWGALSFDAGNEGKTPVLQEVKLEVFEVGVCDNSYSALIDYHAKWPQGMTQDTVLCSGWIEGGRDACKGDSGGPLTYVATEGNLANRHVLGGIVSTGFGCGLKDFPGIYIPINSPEYLQWIKDTAFLGYDDSADHPDSDGPGLGIVVTSSWPRRDLVGPRPDPCE